MEFKALGTISGSREKENGDTVIRRKEMVTTHFIPKDDFVKSSTDVLAVKEFLQKRQGVCYLITGLKVARGVEILETTEGRVGDKKFPFGSEIPEVSSDFVFALQTLEIKPHRHLSNGPWTRGSDIFSNLFRSQWVASADNSRHDYDKPQKYGEEFDTATITTMIIQDQRYHCLLRDNTFLQELSYSL